MQERLRIGVSALADVSWMGGIHYTKTTCQALRRLGPAVHVELLVSQGARDAVRDIAPLVADVVEVPPPRALRRLAFAAGQKLGHQDIMLEYVARQRGLDVVFPTNLGRGASVRWIGWIWDFQHEEHPEFFDAWDLEWRRNMLREMAQNCDWLTVSSNHARGIAARVYPSAEHKLTTLRFASLPDDSWYTGSPAETLARYGINEPFLYLPNQFWAHKNHRTVVEALGLLGPEAPLVVCSGLLHDPRRPNHVGELLRKLQASPARDRLLLLGLVPRQDQINLFRACTAVVNPSLYEGWSTSVEEARSLGKPCVLSDIPLFKEQQPDAVFFSRTDPADAARALTEAARRFSSGSDEKAEQRAREAAEARFDAYAQTLLEVVTRAMATPHPLRRTIRSLLRPGDAGAHP